MFLVGNILYMIPGAIIALTLHEYVKALASAKQGDPLPSARGRLTLNPLKHLEPIGLICMLVLGYGWGKPTETAPIYYKDRKKATIITYTMPSIVNIVTGIIFIMLYKALDVLFANLATGAQTNGVVMTTMLIVLRCVFYAAKLNIALAFFNIIPVYPLDGAKVLGLFLSPQRQVQMTSYEKIFQIILILLLLGGFVNMILSPLVNVFLLLAK